MKKLVALALCAAMTAGSVIGANAAGVKQNTAVKVLDSSFTMPDNTLKVFTYNVSASTTGAVSFLGEKYKKKDKGEFCGLYR